MKNRGVSIIQVLVAAAMLGALAVAFSQFLSGSMKAQKNVQNNIDFDILKNSINLVLNSQNCISPAQESSGKAVKLVLTAAADANGSFLASPVTVERIVHGGGTLVAMNQDLGGGLKITKLQVSSAVPDGPLESHLVDSLPVNYKPYLVRLTMEGTKAEGSLGKKVLTQEFVVRMLANQSGGASDNTNRIEKCGGGGEEVAPTGTVKIEGAGAPYFIDIASRGPKKFTDAIRDCQTRGMRLCSSGQWISACIKNPGSVLQNLNTAITDENIGTDQGASGTRKGEWVEDLYVNGTYNVMNAGSAAPWIPDSLCTQTMSSAASHHQRYRCCK